MKDSQPVIAPQSDHADDASWKLDDPAVIRGIQIGLVVICIVLVLAEFAYEHHHPHFELETVFGLQAWIGFGAFVAAVAIGSLLRLIVSRPEDYYLHDDIPRTATTGSSTTGKHDAPNTHDDDPPQGMT